MKKCLNCGGAHTSLAMSCPERKRKVIEKRKLLKQHKSYASIASSHRAPDMSQPTVNDNESIIKAFMCITISTMKNADHPGTFEQTLSQLLQVNGLPNLSLGKISPPSVASLVQGNIHSTNNDNTSNGLCQEEGDNTILNESARADACVEDQAASVNIPHTAATMIFKKRTPL